MKYEYETQRVKDDARGRWERVLPDLAPALKDAVERRGKHVPCPVHGGRDGFRVFPDVDETGGGVCNTCLLYTSRWAYAAHHSDNPQGMVRVVENVANSLEGRLAEAYEDAARAEKRLADILTELVKPFEQEERLTQLLARQREINAALDLDKDNAGAMEAEAEAA